MASPAEWIIEFAPLVDYAGFNSWVYSTRQSRLEQARRSPFGARTSDELPPPEWMVLSEGVYRQNAGTTVAQGSDMAPRPLEKCIERVHTYHAKGVVTNPLRIRNIVTGECIDGAIL